MNLDDRRFVEHLESSADPGSQRVIRIYCCPCCDYPTVSEPPSYDICCLCSWEDDGCDGYGPNACSLEQARDDFRRYLTSYAPDHEVSPQFQAQHGRFVHEVECSPAALAGKRRLMAMLDEYRREPDLRRRGEIWGQIWGGR